MMDWTPELAHQYNQDMIRSIDIRWDEPDPKKLWLAARERDAQTIAELRKKISETSVALAQWMDVASNRLLEIETLTKRVQELEDKLLEVDQEIRMRDKFIPENDGGAVAFTEGA